VYFKRLGAIDLEVGRERLRNKIGTLRAALGDEANLKRHPFEFFDFGLRRRFSGAWQDEVVSTLADQLSEYFRGTSNVFLAKKYDLVPIGTMAHEYLQTFQAVDVQLRNSQKAALEA